MEGATRLKQGRVCTKSWSLTAVLYRIYIFMFFHCSSLMLPNLDLLLIGRRRQAQRLDHVLPPAASPLPPLHVLE